MSYSTSSFLLYGVKTSEFVEETTLRELGLPQLCPYPAGSCHGELEYFVAINDTVEFINSSDEYSKEIAEIQIPPPDMIELLERVPNKISGAGWWLISHYS